MRPLLKDQIKANRILTDEELIKLLAPPRNIEFWIFRHSELLWQILWWNWFDIWEETENADEYRTWYMKLKRKLFGGNKE